MAEKILVIDDDEELAELLGILFAKKGFETEVALNGKDALAKLETFKPAVIVQDYMLPDVKGVDLLKEMKLSRPDAYVVVITARGSEDVAVEMMKSGASDYVKKPFDTDKLVSTVENVLRLRSSESERQKLVCELQRQNRELLAINALSAALTSSMSRSSKCGSAVDIIMNSMRADITNVFVTRQGVPGLSLLASHCPAGVELGQREFARSRGLAEYISEIQKPALIADISQEHRIKIPEKLVELGMTSALAVPMIHKDEFRGVLEVYTKQARTFASFDIKLLSSFANLLAMALENEAISYEAGLAQRRWQTTCDIIPDRITVQDKGHRIIYANAAAARLAGVSIGDLIGQQCCWMFHNSKEPVKGCPVQEVFATRKPVKKTLTLEGSGQSFQIEASPILNETGEIEYVVEHARVVEG